MKKLNSRTIWGAILIIAGLLFLLESLGILMIGSVWPVIFAIAGLLFLLTFLRDPQQWWPVIPGFTLLGLAVGIGLNAIVPKYAGTLTASVLMGSIGLSFLVILGVTRAREWWAAIPGGVLLTIATVTFLSPYTRGELSGAVFMLGLAVTFGILLLLSTTEKGLRWALYPAAILGLIGILLLAGALQLARLVWPAVLILLGLYIIFRNIRR